MEIEEEKRLIYGLMKQLIEERREISKAYFDLKEQLNSLNEQEINDSKCSKNLKNELVEKGKEKHSEIRRQYALPIPTTRKRKSYPFERVAGYVIEILRNEGIPLSSKVIHEKLQSDYEIYIGYANLTNNILRKMIDLDKYSIEKATRGFYQYRRRGIE
ncbi:hypothetical protein [Enterococcus thailandicus]|uniref:hypothetical protein n=1 Tax=Enterococcus thailandicus TaxID=417368 RepID=UPI0022E4768E|nr:hypothetical protein [Enterococcus thailandicus]